MRLIGEIRGLMTVNRTHRCITGLSICVAASRCPAYLASLNIDGATVGGGCGKSYSGVIDEAEK